MADGTRFQSIERRLDSQGNNITEVCEILKKNKKDSDQKLEGIEKFLQEIRVIVTGLSQEKEGHPHDPLGSNTYVHGMLRTELPNMEPRSATTPITTSHLDPLHPQQTPSPYQTSNSNQIQFTNPNSRPQYYNHQIPNPGHNPNTPPPQMNDQPSFHHHQQPPYYHNHRPHPNQYNNYFPANHQDHYPNISPNNNNPVFQPYQHWTPNKPPRMDFPKFNGVDPRGWIIRAEQYFEFHPIEDYRKSKFASTYFEGRASTWYQFYKAGREWMPWYRDL